MSRILLLVMTLSGPLIIAQPQPYVAVLGGVSTLSGGAASVAGPSPAASSYDPQNGGTVLAAAGVHWNNYLSLEGDYQWNRNGAVLSALGANSVHYQRVFRTEQQALTANALVYFHRRGSLARPYLSVGTGLAHLTAAPDGSAISLGLSPPAGFKATKASLQVAVGIDVRVRRGWAIRYTFSETVTSNPIGAQLTPPSQRVLMNFRNLFGIVKTF